MPEKENVNQNQGPEKARLILANSMPWVISLLFHVGLFLVMFFLVFMVVKEQQSEDIIVPDAVMSETPGGVMNPRPVETKSPTKSQSSQRKQFKRTTKMTFDAGKTQKALSILSPGGSAGQSASDLGMRTNVSNGTKSSFFGTGGNAHNIVYVIDRSGSMAGPPLELVVQEVLKSIGRLKPQQNFHIILFSGNKPLEKMPARLVPAKLENKRKAAMFLRDVLPAPSTNPIPALERAFEVLKETKKPGKLIYLLTDGDFAPEVGEGPGNDKVVREIRKMNADKKVLINTFLMMEKTESAIEVLTQIAKENGGRFKYVSFDD